MESPDDWAISAMVRATRRHSEPDRCVDFDHWRRSGDLRRILLEDCGFDWNAPGVAGRLRAEKPVE